MNIMTTLSTAAYAAIESIGFMSGNMSYWVLFIGIAIISYIVQANLNHI